jgi:hypothetical protein
MACECCGACLHDDGEKKSWDIVIEQALSNASITEISAEALTVRTLILDKLRRKTCTWIERAKYYEKDADG